MSCRFNDSIPTRDSLLGRLKDWDDEVSWQAFYDTYWGLIYGVALRSGLTEVEARDAVQETLIEVARRMKSFKYDPALGSFKGWLMQLTQWRIRDQFRKRQRGAIANDDEADKTRRMEQVPDLASFELQQRCWDDEWEKNLRAVANERVKQAVEPRTYQMYQLYALKEWPVAKVAKTLRVSSTQIYVAKHRVSTLLRKEIHRLATQKF